MLHNDIEASQVFISEVQTRLRHVNVNHFIEDLDVGGGVAADSLDETLVTIGREEVFYIINFYFDYFPFFVCHLLLINEK